MTSPKDEEDVLLNTHQIQTITCDNTYNLKTHINNKKGIKILHMNIRSAKKNLDEFSIFLDSIGPDIDVIILTEAFLQDSHATHCLPRYILIESTQHITKNDGVLIFIKDKWKIEHKKIEITDCTSLLVNISSKETNIDLLGIYRTPSIKNIDPFLNSIDNTLKQTQPIIIGDINLDILKSNTNSEHYLNILAEHGYISCINNYTRITNNSKSCIDHIFLPQRLFHDSITAMIINTAITDHTSQLLCLPNKSEDNTTKQPLNQRQQINYEQLNTLLTNEDWASVMRENDPNTAYTTFLNTYSKHIKECTESKTIKNKERKIKPWITTELVKAIRHRDKMHKNSKNRPFDLNLANYTKRITQELKEKIRETKNTYYKNEIKKAGKDIKKVWKTINDVTNSARTKKLITHIETDEGKIEVHENPKKIADLFNAHYTNIGEKLAKNIKNDNIPTTTNNIPFNPNTIFLTPTTEIEIKQIIKNLKNNNSAGEDNIKTKTLKSTVDNITKPLTHIINNTLTTGIFPDALKNSIITPIFKKGNDQEIVNYRPISILPNLSKVFEKIIHKRLYDFLKCHKILSNRQYSFQKGRCATDAVLDLVEELNINKHDQKHSIIIFLDLMKAFDTIPHKKLIEKLEQVGIRGVASTLIQNYLTDRQQKTQINQIKSDKLNINCGLPQGTVLAPLLFNVYINDLLLLIISGTTRSFADDTSYTLSAKNRVELYNKANADFIIITKWLQNNLLSLNLSKTTYIEIKSSCKTTETNTNLNINGITISKSTKYLGIIIDNKLDWGEHISELTKKIRKTMYKFVQLRNILSQKQLKTTYHALIESHLNYGIETWGSAYQNKINKLEVAQKRVLKIMHKKPNRFPTNELFQIANVHSITELFQIASTFNTYKHKNNKKTVTHNYSTRWRQNEPIHIDRMKTTYMTKQSSHVGSQLYNKLPTEIKNIRNDKAFKTKLKKWLKEHHTNT